MICGDYALTIQKDFVALYFVRSSPITVFDDQNTATCRNLVKMKLVSLGARCIGNTGQEGTHVNSWRITRESLHWLLGFLLRWNRNGDYGAK